jgi:hypothetical protein
MRAAGDEGNPHNGADENEFLNGVTIYHIKDNNQQIKH